MNIRDALRETKSEWIAIIIVAALMVTGVTLCDRYIEAEKTATTEAETTTTQAPETETETTTLKMMAPITETTTAATTTAPETYVTADSLAELQIDGATIDRIAGICYGEARGAPYAEICKVVWCICNRADAWNVSLWDIATAPNQFYYVPNLSYRDIAVDVLNRWLLEKQGAVVQRELGKDYLYFTGDGTRNHYRKDY